MSTQSEINRLNTAKSALKSAIEAKGVQVDSSALIDTYASKVALIVTPDATIYSGSSAPASSLGVNGDIYIKI